jgi:DNA-binding NarL/FixJ family response regulator
MQRGASEASPDAGPRIISKLRRASGFTGSILVLTNSRQLEDGERALQAGCDGYLCKHALISEIPSLVSELKLAMKGNVLLISREMRHVFFREQLSLKEVKLMELVSVGSSWEKISEELGYKTANAAATTGQRVFDKILNAPFEQDRPQAENDLKRSRAIERWQALRKRGAN